MSNGILGEGQFRAVRLADLVTDGRFNRDVSNAAVEATGHLRDGQVSAFDKYRALLTAGDPETTAIHAIVSFREKTIAGTQRMPLDRAIAQVIEQRVMKRRPRPKAASS